MSSERTVQRVQAARRGAVVDLSPEERAELEAEKQQLLESLAQADDEQPVVSRVAVPDDEPEPSPAAAQALATGIGDHAKTESARAHEEDAERLAQIVAGLAPFRAMVESAYARCKATEAEWADFLREMRSVDWRAFGQRHPRGAPLARRIGDVTKGLDEATRLIEYSHTKAEDLLARIDGVTLPRVATDRHYLPEVRWEAELYVNTPKGITDVLWRLRRDAEFIKEALDRMAGEVPVEPSEDAQASALTREGSRNLIRAELDPLPQRPENVKQAAGRVKDKSPFA